ncbi:hypothetical protein M9458_041572, partial [Cirrhinus mrigala]
WSFWRHRDRICTQVLHGKSRQSRGSGFGPLPPTTPVCLSPRTAPYRAPEAPRQPGLLPDRQR